jgi:hypothetical protein
VKLFWSISPSASMCEPNHATPPMVPNIAKITNDRKAARAFAPRSVTPKKRSSARS